MIVSESQHEKYLTHFTNGTYHASADTTKEKGGMEQGFRPHELLEAALACCMNMSLRMHAQKLSIPLEKVRVSVFLNRKEPEHPTFEYDVAFDASLCASDRQALLDTLAHSSVRSTLSKSFSFEQKAVETSI
ncbi:MAG: OsmC family peroxiredoxin [Epsilonproteobacteria bacterium]|nr:OsmC family peroxiredoxin [Campylobacterota bacterium]